MINHQTKEPRGINIIYNKIDMSIKTRIGLRNKGKQTKHYNILVTVTRKWKYNRFNK